MKAGVAQRGNPAPSGRPRERGYALVTVLLLLTLVMTLLASYFTITNIDLVSSYSSMRGTRGLYAAEGGLNVRVKVVRAILAGGGNPSGAAPATTGGQIPCSAGNVGSGELGCIDYALQDRTVSTYVDPSPQNPVPIVVPRGEPFQNRTADEYRYAVGAVSKGPESRREAMLETGLDSRLVPLFQFAAFFDKDLEIRPLANLTLSGPVHATGDLYLDAAAGMSVAAQVTAGGGIYRGRKYQDACTANDLRVADPDDLASLPACTGSRALLGEAALAPWTGMLRSGVAPVIVPAATAIDPAAGNPYWDRADLRIALDLPAGPAIEVRDAAGAADATAGATLAGCGAASYSNTLYNWREATFIEMLDIDVRALFDCIHSSGLLGGGKDLDDASDGGLILHLSVDGPSSGAVNNYGVRLTNAAELASTIPTAPAVVGLTVVTDQALYVQGSYNSTGKKPAAFLADSFNVLSNAWADANSSGALASRPAASTTINAAVLAGSDTTGGVEGAGGQDAGGYNGGLFNLARLHEDWSGVTLTYRGSFVSLDTPRHVAGAWASGSPYYAPPTRVWDYDVDFDDPAKLPPLTPRFTQIRQGFLLRRFGA